MTRPEFDNKAVDWRQNRITLTQLYDWVATEISNQVEAQVIKKIAVKELLCKSKVINKMFKRNFWDAHYIDIGIRLDGKTITEEADWIKELWYLVKDSNFSA